MKETHPDTSCLRTRPGPLRLVLGKVVEPGKALEMPETRRHPPGDWHDRLQLGLTTVPQL